MRWIKSDLFRNFALGFVLGTAAVVVSVGPEMWGGIVSPAQAAPAPQR